METDNEVEVYYLLSSASLFHPAYLSYFIAMIENVVPQAYLSWNNKILRIKDGNGKVHLIPSNNALTSSMLIM